MGIKKSLIIASLILIPTVIILMISIPIITNRLMFLGDFEIAGDEVVWIGYLGTFWGAILGGTISGILTLVGVILTVRSSFAGLNLTIQNQKNEKFKETIGNKLNKLYEVKGIIFKVDRLLMNRKYGWNENYEKDDMKNIEKNISRYLLSKLNYLLELSSAVDWEFYNEIKKFVQESRKILIVNRESDYDDLTLLVESVAERIERNHEERLSDSFEKISK